MDANGLLFKSENIPYLLWLKSGILSQHDTIEDLEWKEKLKTIEIDKETHKRSVGGK